jgi:hypothetical protein
VVLLGIVVAAADGGRHAWSAVVVAVGDGIDDRESRHYFTPVRWSRRQVQLGQVEFASSDPYASCRAHAMGGWQGVSGWVYVGERDRWVSRKEEAGQLDIQSQIEYQGTRYRMGEERTDKLCVQGSQGRKNKEARGG